MSYWEQRSPWEGTELRCKKSLEPQKEGSLPAQPTLSTFRTPFLPSFYFDNLFHSAKAPMIVRRHRPGKEGGDCMAVTAGPTSL